MGNTLPKTNFNLLSADTSVENADQKMLFVGQMTSEGTATAGELIQDIANDNSWDSLFGKRSILANMIRKARRMCADCQYQVQIDAIPLDDVEGATKASATVTFTGTATSTGTVELVVGSSYDNTYSYGVSKDDTASEIATALKQLIDADTKCPFTATVASGVLTITFANAGTVGKATTIKAKNTALGVTTALTAFASGANDPVMTGVLDVVENIRYQGLCMPVEYGVVNGIALLDPRFNTNNKLLDGALFVSKTDTLANHKATINALNSKNAVYVCNKAVDKALYKGSSIIEFDFILAVYTATMRALRISTGSQLSNVLIGQYPEDLMGGVHNNSLPFFNTLCPYLNKIDPSVHWSSSANNNEVDELNDAGGCIYDNNSAENGVIMGDLLTTYKTDIAGNEDETWKFLNYRDTGSAIREFRFLSFKKDFAQSRLSDDSEGVVRGAFLRYFKKLADKEHRLLRAGAYKYYDANLKVSIDFQKGKVTVISKDPYVTQLREVNGFFKAVFDITTGEAVG